MLLKEVKTIKFVCQAEKTKPCWLLKDYISMNSIKAHKANTKENFSRLKVDKCEENEIDLKLTAKLEKLPNSKA